MGRHSSLCSFWQVEGYLQLIHELKLLSIITGFDACSLQPIRCIEEHAGLMVIRGYQKDQGQGHHSAYPSRPGTNPASAIMAGMIVIVACDDKRVDVEDLQKKAELHKDRLSCIMITYPSTHECWKTICEITEIMHKNGGWYIWTGPI